MIKVSGESQSSKNILIFPTDVKNAEIEEELTIGTKIKFRPRVEGNLTFASDIRLVTLS